MTATEGVLLSGYASKRCARRVHNDHDATIPKAEWEPPADLRARFDAGVAFEREVLAELEARLGADLGTVSERSATARIEATLRAMAAGATVIAGGQLPHDHDGGRIGRPDLLVRRTPDGDNPGYVPVEIKHHLMTKEVRKRSIQLSTLSEPWSPVLRVGRSVRVAERFDDWLQLAHYTRMLQACGFHAPGVSQAGVVGTDALDDGHPAIVWFHLDAPRFTTYSRSRGKAERSALERYDHEHEFRVRVAQRAQQRTGSPDDPEPLVVPVWQQECETCPHQEHCRSLLGQDNASVEITTGRLDVREWLALGDLGVTTTTGLATLDVGDEAFAADYLPRVTHAQQPLERLATAVVRAQMVVAGESLRRIDEGPLVVPRADVEVDFDIEWDTAGRVYLWGVQVRRGDDAPATYAPFVSWEELDEESERALARDFAAWLRGLIRETEARGETIAVYHYTAAERTHLRRVLGDDETADLLERFVDLHAFVKQHFIGVAGLGVKKVAPAFGFEWRDEDPSGLASQTWLLQARDASDTAGAEQSRRRLLDYNEDDVGATAAVRDGLRRSDLSQ